MRCSLRARPPADTGAHSVLYMRGLDALGWSLGIRSMFALGLFAARGFWPGVVAAGVLLGGGIAGRRALPRRYAPVVAYGSDGPAARRRRRRRDRRRPCHGRLPAAAAAAAATAAAVAAAAAGGGGGGGRRVGMGPATPSLCCWGRVFPSPPPLLPRCPPRSAYDPSRVKWQL